MTQTQTAMESNSVTQKQRAQLQVQGNPTLDSWQSAPDNRWVFRQIEELLPSAAISAVPVSSRVQSAGLGAFSAIPNLEKQLEDTYTDALLIERRGEVLGEWYANGFGPSRTHLLMSVSKSLCGIVVGTLIDDGLLDPEQLAGAYVPALVGSAYGDATIQQLLDMVAAADYSEDYTNPASEVQAHDRAARWRSPREGDPADTFTFLTGLTRSGEHGARFQYCSAVTDALGWIVEAVTERRYAEEVSDRLWSRIGVENDARISVDRGGCAIANGGISCTARDLARVGRLMLDAGVAKGQEVVSSQWVAQTMAGGDPELALASPNRAVFPGLSYRNQWWSTGNERGNVYAVGIHGQYIWLDPISDTVIVKFSTLPEPVTTAHLATHAELFGELVSVPEGIAAE